MDARAAQLAGLAARHDDVLARWQLVDAGWSPKTIVHRTADLRVLLDGVYLTSHSKPSRRQRWRAATLTAPDSWLADASAAACFGFRPYSGYLVAIVRRGTGGPRRSGWVRIRRSSTLDGDTTDHEGLPITTAARTLLDIAPSLSDRALRKAFREALRLRVTTTAAVLDTLARHPRRSGCAALHGLADRYARLPIERCRSDGEAMALEVLDRAGRPIPLVNEPAAGEEADLWWPDRRLIIEVDGPDFHRFRDEDARKTAIWRAAGLTVRRVPSDDVFDRPHLLLGMAPPPQRGLA